MGDFKETYKKNREALGNYTWWRYDELPAFEGLTEDERRIDETLYVPTKINTKPFFRDLSKPLLVKNEYNSYHFGYLIDNVRASEDFGEDNHIYMYYDSFGDFYRLLQAVDITPYLQGDKIVFLIGAEDLAEHYPLNFKKEYGINYEAMGSKPLRVDEIQRLIISWHNSGYSGNVLWSGVLDWHKNFLTIKSMGLVGIHYIYEKILKSHTVKEAYELLMDNESLFIKIEFDALFSPMHISGKTDVPSPSTFFSELAKLFPDDYCPREDEWLKGMFLAYSIALGRRINTRISPTIVFYSHFRGPIINMNDNLGWIKKFKYFRCISMLRRYTIVVASCMEHDLKKNDDGYCQLLNAITYCVSLQWQENAMGDCYNMPLYVDENSFYFPYTKIVRFEDLKLEPMATLEAVLDFFDVEWDDNLWHTTANGQTEVWYRSDRPVKDFDPAPALRKREKMMAPFDYYRIELLMGDFLTPWGYKPQYYTDGKKYTNEEIKEMVRKKFKCEEFLFTYKQRQENEGVREKLYEAVRERLEREICIAPDGRKLVPIPWLKPKVRCELEN